MKAIVRYRAVENLCNGIGIDLLVQANSSMPQSRSLLDPMRAGDIYANERESDRSGVRLQFAG